jgi:hypothetical protein
MKDSGLSKPHLYDPKRYYVHHEMEVFEATDCGKCPAEKRGACWQAFWQLLACIASRKAPEGTRDYENLYETYKEVYNSEKQSLELYRLLTYREHIGKEKSDGLPTSGKRRPESDWEYTPF